MTAKKSKQYKTVSLFSGAGGLDIGFAKAKFEIVWANDFDKDAVESYRVNIGDHIVKGSIFDLHKEYPTKDVDVLIGGPPCQGFSVAGKMDPHDERSKLIWEYVKVLNSVKPKAFVMENVKALGMLEKWAPIREELIKSFKKAGYSCDYIVLNAKEFGVPQSRERVFFIGIKGKVDLKLHEYFSGTHEKSRSSRDVLLSVGRIGSNDNPNTCTAKITLTDNPVMRKSPYAGMLFNGLGRPIKIQGPCQTLPASMGGNKTPIIDNDELYNNSESWIENYHSGLLKGMKPIFGIAPERLRRMSITEAAALQTFPQDYNWKGSKTSIYKQIGNAVPPNLAFHVAKYIDKMLNKTVG